MANAQSYSYVKTIGKFFKYFVVFIIGIVIQQLFVLFPQFMELSVGQIVDKILVVIFGNASYLTVGSLLVALLNYLKHRCGYKII